jgi:hypothetical protein
MDCSTSAPETARRDPRAVRLGVTIGAVVLLAVSSPSADSSAAGRSAVWETDSRVWLGAGYESDASADPERDRTAIGGGAFVSLAPSLFAARRVGTRGDLSFSLDGSAERFDGDAARTLAAVSARGDLTLRRRGPLFGRFSAGFTMFEDSEIDLADRRGASLRAALGWGTARRVVEIHTFARERRYPDLVTPDDAGVPGTYDESASGVGLSALARVGGAVAVRGEIVRERTDARDPVFDSRAWYVRGDVAYASGTGWKTTVSTVLHRRDYDFGEPASATADYLQAGLRLDRIPRRRYGWTLQYTYVSYDDTAGADDGHRVAAFATFRFGSRSARRAAVDDVSAGAAAGEPAVVEGGLVRFRLRAPEAAAVFVTGDFNGWDPSADPLQPSGAGWWETVVPLPPGTHQYAFVVDGAWLPPPAPATLVDDGFGGRNGVLRVPGGTP